MKNNELIDYLEGNSSEKIDSGEFVGVLNDCISEWSKGYPDDKAFEREYKELVGNAKNVHKEFIPYSEITRIIFELGTDGLDMFVPKLKNRIKNDIDNLKGTDEVPNQYLVIIKCIEHVNLASKQLDTLYNKQDRKIKEANGNLKGIEKQIDSLGKKADTIETESNEKYSKLTIDFVTILGIFTSITFATFGGLQLLGNVFGNVKELSRVNVGNEIMLGAIFLFGTYLILIALLTGISKLTGLNYETSFPTRYVMVLSFAIIFVIGLLYANMNWISYLQTNWFLSLGSIIVAILVPLKIDNSYRYHRRTGKWFRWRRKK